MVALVEGVDWRGGAGGQNLPCAVLRSSEVSFVRPQQLDRFNLASSNFAGGLMAATNLAKLAACVSTASVDLAWYSCRQQRHQDALMQSGRRHAAGTGHFVTSAAAAAVAATAGASSHCFQASFPACVAKEQLERLRQSIDPWQAQNIKREGTAVSVLCQRQMQLQAQAGLLARCAIILQESTSGFLAGRRVFHAAHRAWHSITVPR